MQTYYLLLLSACLLFLSCKKESQLDDSANQPVSETELFTTYYPQRFYSAIRKKGELLVVAPQTGAYQEAYRQIVREMRGVLRESVKLVVLDPAKANPSQLDTSVVLLLGTVASNPLIETYGRNAPIVSTEAGFTFLGTDYEGREDSYILGAFQRREATGTVAIISGNEERSFVAWLSQHYDGNWQALFRNPWSYQVFSEGDQRLMGKIRKVEGEWELDEQAHWELPATDGNEQTPDWLRTVVHGEVHAEDQKELLAQLKNGHEQIEAFAGQNYSGELAYHLYPSAEIKGLLTNNTNHAHVSFDRSQVHVVANEVYRGNNLQAENRIFLRKLLGPPKITALEVGLAVSFAKNWQKYGHNHWVSKLYHSGNLVPAQELLSNEWFEKESRLVFDGMAAAFTQFLIHRWGKERFLRDYARWQPTQSEINALEGDWSDFVEQLTLEIDSVPPHFVPSIPRYFKGFNFAHEGYQIYNGYGSKEATRSLERLKEIGTNAVALVPYSYMPDPRKPNFLKLSAWAGGETDESVVHSAFEAKKKGMCTMLKPQVWFGMDSWPGEAEMKTEADWKLFFDYYHRWVRHYALLAEIHELDLFCLGVEFAKATAAKPEEWVRLAEATRKIYSGKLTYAANWGAEIENTQFWGSFDFIGVNCYYPLAQSESATKEELKQGFRKTMSLLNEKLSGYGKPIVLTEIGFRSVEGTWKQPHTQPNGAKFNEQAQTLAYKAVFEVLAENNQGCSGVFWWKWPSYLSYADKNKTSFTPAKRSAEQVVQNWFGKL